MGKVAPVGLEGAGYTQSRLRVSGGGPLGSSSRLRMPDGMYMVMGRPRRNIFTEMPSTERRGVSTTTLQPPFQENSTHHTSQVPHNSSRGCSPNPKSVIPALPDSSVHTQIIVAPPRPRTPRAGEGVFPPTAVGKREKQRDGVRSQDLSGKGQDTRKEVPLDTQQGLPAFSLHSEHSGPQVDGDFHHYIRDERI